MCEKEKMLKQQLYDANYDKTLINERMAAKDLCFKFNHVLPSDLSSQSIILKQLIPNMKNAIITAPFWCDYGYNINLGKNFYANHNLVILDAAPVKFGDNVFIGPNCSFYTSGHPLDYSRRNKGLEYAYPITIADNVWFGGNVVVLPGVSIGKNSIIAAGSVVTKNIPSNCIAAGNPCKLLRFLTKEDLNKNYNR